MTVPDITELVSRIERLERLVEELVARSAGVSTPAPPATTAPPATAPAPPQPLEKASEPAAVRITPPEQPSRPAAPVPDRGPAGERWLARAGIGFVILAFAFLLKLSFDRGWITPALRLVAGSVAGLSLLATGLKLEEERRRLAQALLGGAVALFYLVGWAGFQLYGLVPFWPALVIMTATTFLSFVLSDRQDVAVLALIGVAGGLATPFLLGTGTRDPEPLALYTAVVLLGAGAVQLHRGWLSLLAMVVLGGGLVVSAMSSAPVATPLTVSAGILAYWLVAGISPLTRPLGEGRAPAAGEPMFEIRGMTTRLAWGFTTTVALAASASVWSLERVEAGVLTLAVAAGTSLLAWGGRRVPLCSGPAGDLAGLAAAAGLVMVADWSTGLLLVVGEAALLFHLVGRGAPRSLAKVAHLLLWLSLIALVPVAVASDPEGVMLAEGAWARLAVLAGVALLSLRMPQDAASLYRLAVHVGLLAWFALELGRLSNGLALISIAWALQGGFLLLAGIRTGSRGAKVLALLTLGLVAGKLLLLDLASVDAVWRIFLFLGFGAALLGLSYLVGRPAARPVRAEAEGSR